MVLGDNMEIRLLYTKSSAVELLKRLYEEDVAMSASSLIEIYEGMYALNVVNVPQKKIPPRALTHLPEWF